MAPTDLFTPSLSPPKAPDGRDEPRLWVRRLVIFKNVSTLIRDVSLRPGLNIIWTPDMSNSGQSALAHGSGKSTFCRLIRACLGEPDFAMDSQRTRIMTRLPEGGVGAEVIVNGICWVVVRFFGLGHDFVVEADCIEDALARGRQEGDQTSLDAIITRAFFASLIGRSPPEVSDQHLWDVIRAWLSRDQECRLADILAWRSPRTQTRSRAQVLGETSKLTMVRLALRALDAEEQRATERERALAAIAEEERRSQTYRDQRRSEKFAVLRRAFGVGDDVGLEDTIDQLGLVSRAQAAFDAAVRAEIPKSPDVSELFTQQENINRRRTAQMEIKQKKDTEAERKRADARSLRSEAEIGELDVAHSRIRVCPICKVDVEEVLANNCKISLQRCDVEAIRKSIDQKKNNARLLDQEADKLEGEAKRIDAIIQQIDAEAQKLSEQAKGANAAVRAAQQAATIIQDQVYQARRLLDDARALRDGMPSAKSGPPMAEDIDAVRAQLEQGRRRAQQAIRALEDRYRGIMTAWLPEGVDGFIKLDGKGLKVDAQFSGRGEVSTAALDSLKIVAFDLAALHMAIEEEAILPPFLIHDSPREADLDGTLYARLFQLVQGWEGESCGFQYIVTTTTAPPTALQGDPFVRLTMSSTPADNRLFKMDL